MNGKQKKNSERYYYLHWCFSYSDHNKVNSFMKVILPLFKFPYGPLLINFIELFSLINRALQNFVNVIWCTNSSILLCFFKFVSPANNSKSCPPNNWPRIKNVAIYIFLEQTTLQTCGFWAVEALEAWIWDYLNITLAQKWHSDMFQISAEKRFQAWKMKFSVLTEWI